ncbi:MAG: hypothetical protein OER88_00505, partial [Planctomycetota bacterium]|nr:hypothetical protein [Planctomycetota bacterium]
VRRGGARWRALLEPLVATERNLPILTALRRLQGKPDPVRVVVRGGERLKTVFPDLPVLHVTLDVVEGTPVSVQQNGNYRSGRQARWRFEGEHLASTKRWGMGGGMSQRVAMKRGETWSTELSMGAFVECPPAGTYTVRVLYHDTLTIANHDSVARLICSRSKPLTLVVAKRPVRVSREGRRIVTQAIAKLDPKEQRKVILGPYGPGNESFLPKASPAGVIMGRGWEAVPLLIGALDADELPAGRRAWLLALLTNITGALTPKTRHKVYGPYAAEGGSGPVMGKSNGELQGGMAVRRSRTSSDGDFVERIQLAHAAKWRRFGANLEVKEAE